MIEDELTPNQLKEITDLMWDEGLDYAAFKTINGYNSCIRVISSILYRKKQLNEETRKDEDYCAHYPDIKLSECVEKIITGCKVCLRRKQ